MKTNRLFCFGQRALLTFAVIACGLFRSAAQYPIPVVTIIATDPNASWQGDPGTFTVYRAGDTNAQLNVYYQIGGTASNGVDYASIGNIVAIPAGVRTGQIVIKPIDHGQSDTKTVVLTLAPSPFLTPVNYQIGNPSNAVVFIRATATNLPPLARITTPVNAEVFRAPADIPIVAYARDFDGFVSSVELFENNTSLGLGHELPVASSLAGQFFGLVWSNAPVGKFALTAVATDNDGATGTSAPVTITVISPVPPPTNRPPVVNILAVDPIAIEGTNCWPWRGLTNATPTWSAWTATSPIRYYTNCGPKSALFAVDRFGDTNDPVTVTYEIGGTATNGIDYITLDGTITIPAGQRRAFIPVVPIDDGTPDITSTVVLALNNSTNSPPDYFVGYPRKAAAIILDYPSTLPPVAVLADRCFRFNASGPDGAWFRVEATSDLLHWTPICTNQVVQGGINFVDPEAPDNSLRYYRSVPEASAP